MPFSCGLNPIGDDTYFIDITFNADQNSSNYSIKNARIVSSINNDVSVLSAFYSDDGPSYNVPSVSYDEAQKIECFSEKGYVHLRMLLSGSEAKNLNLKVEYDIMGEGLYSLNKFHQTWEEVALEL